MSQPEPTPDRSEQVTDAEVTTDAESDPDSGFLRSIEFLTGSDPNLGSFLLVVGAVTCVFIALFQFTLPTPISYILTAGVIFVTVLSAVFASLLDSLGYFDRSTATVEESDQPSSRRKPWVPVGKQAAPLPPLINFDAELRAYAELFDGDLPSEFEPFLDDYRRLKTNTENRATIASDLRADLNPIGTLFADGSEGDSIYEEISGRLFRYISNQRGHVSMRRLAFYDDGTETDVRAIRNALARLALAVSNDGEAADVDVVVRLYDDSDHVIASRTCKVGVVGPGATKGLETDLFVPTDAVRASTTIRVGEPDRVAASA